jgi:hypothetical protein
MPTPSSSSGPPEPCGASARCSPLLAERPSAKGLAVPGMPVGSPGMQVEGAAPEIYEVVLFGEGMRTTFARYQGGRAI